ncbi:MAG TPA: J domain-containing protein [Hyphomicrobiaceae bacterium]|jgi:curved DNA-binding protein CbpA|nr:J domain-containing protein [Hyphomicrobiaceae bacterium]
MRNLYSVLQVAPKASDAEIKAAFRNVVKTCHPDVKPGDPEAEQAFQEAKRAYKFLSKPETRKIYDDYLAHRQAAARQRLRRAAATMSATFLLTAASVVLVGLWLSGTGLPLSSRLLAETPETAGALEVARRADRRAHQVDAQGARP